MNQRPSVVEIPVALVRDYQQINRELIRALDAGHSIVRLIDVEGQRLLAAGLRGPWSAVVEVIGNAGPELAADLDAPALSVLCRGSAADGAGRGLRAGRLIIEGGAGDSVGASMSGGLLAVAGPSGHRAGMRQRGGSLILLGPVGNLLADRQSGGTILARSQEIARMNGRGRTGGRVFAIPEDCGPLESDIVKVLEIIELHCLPGLVSPLDPGGRSTTRARGPFSEPPDYA